MDDSYRDILVRGVAAARARDIEEARFYLNWLMTMDPPMADQLEAWYWLSEISPETAEKRQYLENILADDPTNLRARRAMAILDGRLTPAEIIDPDRIHQPVAADPQAAVADRFTCPRCGGRLTFAPDGQSLTCESCESSQKLAVPTGPAKNLAEDDFLIAMATGKGHLLPVEVKTITCKGCGATVVVPPGQMTLTCPFCGSAYIIEQIETRQLATPDGIIPFKNSADQARKALRAWFEAEPPPGPYKTSRDMGIYLPVWSFTITGVINWQGTRVENRQIVSETGKDLVDCRNRLALASRRLPPELRPAIRTFNLDELVPYDERYLANWPAETYQIAPGDASLEARAELLAEEKAHIQAGQIFHLDNFQANSFEMVVESFSLILLPVWLTNYTINDKRYEVLINGQTGGVYGTRPAHSLRRIIGNLF